MSISRNFLPVVVVWSLFSPWATAEQPAGLVAEWPFDECSGNTAKDTSGNGDAANLQGASWG